MLRTTEHENGQTIPLSGGAGAVRPWGGLWSRERTHPGAPRPLSLLPSKEGIFMGEPLEIRLLTDRIQDWIRRDQAHRPPASRILRPTSLRVFISMSRSLPARFGPTSSEKMLPYFTPSR
jgi:hypothetical protein